MANCMANSTVLTSGVSTFKLSALVRKEDNFFNSLMSSVELPTCITHDDSWDGHSRAGFDGMTIVGNDVIPIIVRIILMVKVLLIFTFSNRYQSHQL